MKHDWIEKDLSLVLDYFVDGFENTDEKVLVKGPNGVPLYEAFIDPIKAKVVFKLVIE